jgi:osmotically inducible protein OsmC
LNITNRKIASQNWKKKFNNNLNNVIMQRSATANWKGSGKEGKGMVTAQSGIFSNTPISYHTRFEEVKGTSPEELVAAAHAGCFSMKLSFVLGAAGFTPDNIDTKCTITLENGTITESHLEVTASVPNISDEKFNECAEDAKLNCPISKLYKTNITMEARLVQKVSA